MDKRLLDIFDLIELSNPDICIVVTDKDLEAPGPRILYVNKKWEEITGYSKEEVLCVCRIYTSHVCGSTRNACCCRHT